jgi:hypothetical protein
MPPDVVEFAFGGADGIPDGPNELVESWPFAATPRRQRKMNAVVFMEWDRTERTLVLFCETVTAGQRLIRVSP